MVVGGLIVLLFWLVFGVRCVMGVLGGGPVREVYRRQIQAS
jgi:hypothetical protein